MTVTVDEAPRLLLRIDLEHHGSAVPVHGRRVLWTLHPWHKVIEMQVEYCFDESLQDAHPLDDVDLMKHPANRVLWSRTTRNRIRRPKMCLFSIYSARYKVQERGKGRW